MRYTLICIVAALVLFAGRLNGQELTDLFDDISNTDFTYATFKTTRVVNGQSVEQVPAGEMIFIISHHFGRLNQGPYELFGLDQGTIRLGLEYGIKPWLTVAVGRSSFEKTYDGFVKARLLRQSSGSRAMPVTLSYFGGTALNSLRWQDTTRENFFSSRLSYTHQILIARKFSDMFSVQLSPTLVHRNLVKTAAEPNDVYAVGAGGRLRLSRRTTFNAEYFFVLPGQLPAANTNSLSLGVDIETGGHVFQLHLTNSYGMFERNFITENTGKWSKGDIYFGFNITRVFTLRKKEPVRQRL
jgi:hypothetical protein